MMAMHTVTTYDFDHEDHTTEVEEEVRDEVWDHSAVEVTRWMRCHDCGVTYIGFSVEVRQP